MVTLKRIYFSEIYISIQIYDFLLVFYVTILFSAMTILSAVFQPIK